jgi:AhpD family alkylhydroperoxidase
MNTTVRQRDTGTAERSSLRPELDAAMTAFNSALKGNRRLPERLVELVRLRIAYHNQCRPCMSIRYGAAVDDGLTEDLVCSLEAPADAESLTEAEKVAVAYADRFASNHLAIDRALLSELAKHFSPGEIQELAMNAAFFTGFGRMGAVFDRGEALPVGPRRDDGVRLTPWGIQPNIVRGG